jgi:glutaredoxin
MVEIFGKPNCPWCDRAIALAAAQRLSVIYRDFTKEVGALSDLKQRVPGVKTVPQIFIGDRHIGGYEQFAAYVASGSKSA